MMLTMKDDVVHDVVQPKFYPCSNPRLTNGDIDMALCDMLEIYTALVIMIKRLLILSAAFPFSGRSLLRHPSQPSRIDTDDLKKLWKAYIKAGGQTSHQFMPSKRDDLLKALVSAGQISEAEASAKSVRASPLQIWDAIKARSDSNHLVFI